MRSRVTDGDLVQAHDGRDSKVFLAALAAR